MYRHVRSHRTIYRQQAGIDPRRAGVGVVTGQYQRPLALFGQAAMAVDIIGIHFKRAVVVIADSGMQRTLIDDRPHARNVGDKLRRAVSHARRVRNTKLLGDIIDGIEHARTVNRLAQIDHPPAVQRIDPRCAHIGGGGLQHVGNLRRRHVRETLQ
ncbi:hypothetical protein D3C78_1172580 [compost metagenome]